MIYSRTFDILGISGSLRQASYNTALLRAAAELMRTNMSMEIFDLSPLPMFSQETRKSISGISDPFSRPAGTSRCCLDRHT